jgi:hypothetical protein
MMNYLRVRVLTDYHEGILAFTQWPFRCCQSPQICTACAEIFLCLNSADFFKKKRFLKIFVVNPLRNSQDRCPIWWPLTHYMCPIWWPLTPYGGLVWNPALYFWLIFTSNWKCIAKHDPIIQSKMPPKPPCLRSPSRVYWKWINLPHRRPQQIGLATAYVELVHRGLSKKFRKMFRLHPIFGYKPLD